MSAQASAFWARLLAAYNDPLQQFMTTTTAYTHMKSYQGQTGAPRGLTTCAAISYCERFFVALHSLCVTHAGDRDHCAPMLYKLY